MQFFTPAASMNFNEAQSYIAEHKGEDLSSETSVISMVMSIEAQALDLYQRVAQKIQHPASKKIVNQIANEEKVHLKHLGELMDSL